MSFVRRKKIENDAANGIFHCVYKYTRAVHETNSYSKDFRLSF